MPNSSAIMASRISNTLISPSDPDEFCDRLKLLLQDKQAGNNSDLISEEIIAIGDKYLEYKCKSKKQHNQILPKSNHLHTQKSNEKYTYSNYTKTIICNHVLLDLKCLN